MAPFPFLVFFVLSHLLLLLLLLLHSAAHETTDRTNCPPRFHCGEHPEIGFPFSNETYPLCGLRIVNCTESIRRIQMEEGGEWFNVSQMAQANTITIHDHIFAGHLQSRSCESFNNFTYLNSPSLSFTIPQNSTFFKCKNRGPSPDLGNQFVDYLNYSCYDDIIYYNFLKDSQSLLSGSLPHQCSVIQLPVNLSNKLFTRSPPPLNQAYNNPFTHLTAELSLAYHFSSDCFHCITKRGHCEDISKEEFQCAGLKKGIETGKSKLPVPLILSTAIPGVTIIFIAFFFILWRPNIRKNVSSYFIPRSSYDPPKADLEEGSVYFGVPVFTYCELEEATNSFNTSKELGDGGFGTVYHGKLRDGRDVAVKRLYENNYKRVEQFMNEIEILTRLRHRNLVSLYGCTSRRSRELLLVYEYIPNGTVADHLHGDKAKLGSLTWPIRMNIAIETASALAYLHASDIIHRDVKTDNILLDSNFCVKVADFGLSRLFPNDVSHVSTAPQGTPGYVDPEYHQCYQLTDKSDVYSFGVVLVELISSLPAVDISRHRHETNLANLAINRIQKGVFSELVDPSLGFQSDTIIQRMTTSVAELAFQCLQHEKDMRPSMDEVLEALKEIQGEEYQEERKGLVIDHVGAQKSLRPPFSPESDDAVLLKKKNQPPSPDCVTDKWDSGSTISNKSG